LGRSPQATAVRVNQETEEIMSLSLMLRGRQSGKTHTIIALMQKNPESIVIVPWLRMADAYVKAGIARDRVFSVETLDRLRGRKVNSSGVH
jgi:hypothetical protein